MDKRDLWLEREELVNKAIACEDVPRIPVIYMGIAASPAIMGMSMAEFVKDGNAALNVTLDYMDRLENVDGVNSHPSIRINVALTNLWLTRIEMPGRELPENSVWQAAEKEVMKVEDYDLIINEGFEALQAKLLPQVIDMEEVNECVTFFMENLHKHIDAFHDRGYVMLNGGTTTIPFETICGARSMSQFFMDLYRRPELVKKALDVITPSMIAQAEMSCQMSGINRVWVGGWRSASAMLAPKIWNEFVFPYFHEICWALVEKGITPILHWDQDWTRDLDRLLELPAQKCILNPDGMTDLRKFKEVVGDHMSILGDVPASILATGTPDDVYNYTRDLIRDCGPKGLMICPGCDAPINSKHDNMKAMVDATVEFGSGRV